MFKLGNHSSFFTVLLRYFVSGMDLSQCDYDGRTPLHVAATHGTNSNNMCIACALHVPSVYMYMYMSVYTDYKLVE